MARFNVQKLREIADEGIARHGLRGYARKLALDVSTLRSLRDGRDMQISKLMEIIAALGLSLDMHPATPPAITARKHDTTRKKAAPPEAADSAIQIGFHPEAPQAGPAYVSFQPRWLQALGWEPAHLWCLRAPTATSANCVPPGALCLLESSQHWPSGHAIWAYLEADRLHVGYLSRPAPGLLLISGCNPSHPTRQVSGAALDLVKPLGRVVWVGMPLADFR